MIGKEASGRKEFRLSQDVRRQITDFQKKYSRHDLQGDQAKWLEWALRQDIKISFSLLYSGRTMAESVMFKSRNIDSGLKDVAIASLQEYLKKIRKCLEINLCILPLELLVIFSSKDQAIAGHDISSAYIPAFIHAGLTFYSFFDWSLKLPEEEILKIVDALSIVEISKYVDDKGQFPADF